MERVLLIMWFVSLVFVCIIGYREIINAVPYGLEMASKIVSENNGMDDLISKNPNGSNSLLSDSRCIIGYVRWFWNN